MMPDMPERRMFAAIALALCVVPLCLAPLAGRSAKEMSTERALYEARFSQTPAPSATDSDPVRDPFAGEETPAPSASAGPAAGIRTTPAPVVIAVHAVVTGSAARALVEENGRVRIVEPGDALGNARVEAIVGDGIRLSNGTFISLSDKQQ